MPRRASDGPAHSDYIVYVDETGDHSLTSIDPAYPVFGLAFCVFEKSEYACQVLPQLTEFKFEHFGHDQVILHGHEIRKAKGDFTFLVNRERREAFQAGLSELLANAPFCIIAGIINKMALKETYAHPDSPYDLALQFCMERLQMHLGSRDTTYLIVERRGRKEDEELELAFRRIRDGGHLLRDPSGSLPFKLHFADKRSNSSGLQLADLVARPVAMRVLRPDQDNRAWDTLEPKVRRSPVGRIEGWGLKVFPAP